jgi:hypothetical protein
VGRSTRRPAREDEDDKGGDTHHDTACDVQRVVHSAIHAG